MKTGIKILALMLAGMLLVGNLAGCGKKEKGGQSTTDIEISYWNSGLGTEWLDAVIAGFKEKHPEYNVYYNATASTAGALAAYGLEDTDTIDLYLAVKEYNETYMEPLNDVLDTTVEGENKSIKEKFDEAYLQLEEVDGKYYTLTYGGGILGFVYNKDLFRKAGIEQLPRTTDEFSLVCQTLNERDIKPLCHFATSGYYTWLQEAWFAQYEGMDNFFDFYTNPSKEKLTSEDGRYEVLKAYEKICTPDNVLQGSNTESHVTMQTKFLEGKCAMMLNGSWLSTEMSYSGKIDNFEMMRTPVLSAITDKLETVNSEIELRKLISAIDDVTDGTTSIENYKSGESYLVDGKTISTADWDYVSAARNSYPANFSDQVDFIPTYSNAKEGAKEFLKYLYSDEGYQIYMDSLHIQIPLSLSTGEVDTTDWNAFEKNQAQLFEQAEYCVTNGIMNKHRIYTDGGADSFADESYINLMCANNEADRKSAKQIWDTVLAKIEEKYEKEWLKNIE